MPPARSRRATALRAALALGFGSAILGLLLAHLPIAQAFEWSIYDLRMRRTIAPAGAPKRIAIVEIDEQTLRALEPIAGRWPWPRLFHGGLIDYLARGPAAVVAYDVGFFEAGRPHRVRRRRRHVDRRRVGRRLRGVGPEGRQRRAAGRGHLRRFRRRQGRRRPPRPADPRPAHRRRARGAGRSSARRSRRWPRPRAGWDTTCSCSTRTGRCAGRRRSCAPRATPSRRWRWPPTWRWPACRPRRCGWTAACSPPATPGCRCCRSRCRGCPARPAPSARCTR